MTTRDYLFALLSAKTCESDDDLVSFIIDSFGCPPSDFSTAEECHRHVHCTECWHSWLEKEVTTNDH